MCSCTLVLAALAVSASSCAASFSGELDNRSVAAFGSAAFGSTDTDGVLGFGAVHVAIGVLAPGDSCVDGAEFLKLQRKHNEAQGDERQDRAEDLADFANERLAIDAWYGTVTLVAGDDNDLDDVSVDLGEQDDVRVSLSLCQHDDEWEANDGEIDNNDDCFVGVNGDVDVSRSDDERVITLVSEDGVDFDDDGGNDEGELTFTINMTECDDMNDEVEDSFWGRCRTESHPPDVVCGGIAMRLLRVD